MERYQEKKKQKKNWMESLTITPSVLRDNNSNK